MTGRVLDAATGRLLSLTCASGPPSARPVPGSERYTEPPPHAFAGAIAPATSLRWYQDQPGAKAPGQRPPRPPAGASPPPGRALAFVALGETVPVGPWSPRAGKGDAFPDPPGPAGAFKRTGPFSGKGVAGTLFRSLPWLQTFPIQPLGLPPLHAD